MIHGIGTDLVRISRIEEALERRGDRFAQKILDDREFAEYQRATNPASFLAKRFAAKEAMAKALGIGLMREFGLHDLCVDHDDLGKPIPRVSEKSKAVLSRLGIACLHISITDDDRYAQAFAVAERD